MLDTCDAHCQQANLQTSWPSVIWSLSSCSWCHLWSKIVKVQFRKGAESSMELIFKRSAATLSFVFLLVIIFSSLQFHFYPNLLSTWQRRWQLFQSEVILLNWQTDSETTLDQKTDSATTLDQEEEKLSNKRLNKSEEERSRSDIFGKEMAEKFRRRVEQVEHIYLDIYLYLCLYESKPKTGKLNKLSSIHCRLNMLAWWSPLPSKGKKRREIWAGRIMAFLAQVSSVFLTGFKIMRRQERAREKFAKRRGCLNFASVNTTIPLSLIVYQW